MNLPEKMKIIGKVRSILETVNEVVRIDNIGEITHEVKLSETSYSINAHTAAAPALQIRKCPKKLVGIRVIMAFLSNKNNLWFMKNYAA